MKTAAVLGAGLQGVCAALALQRKGYRAYLVDQAPGPMLRASLRNEGKVHLGFVYAKDGSFRTSRLMLESALRFAPLLEDWLGGALNWDGLRTRPFTYLVMRDSLLSPEELFAHYRRLEESYGREAEAVRSYLGLRPARLWRRIPTPGFVAPERVAAAAATEEVALDLAGFRRELLARLEAIPGIERLFGRRVDSVAGASHGFSIEGRSDGGESWRLSADVVVNCLWSGRLEIDRQLGWEPTRPWVHRLKYRVLAELPRRLASIPALTLVLGAYGDIVPCPGGSYLSWYPACRRGWSTELAPPVEWEDACRGEVVADEAVAVSREVFSALEPIVPGISEARTTQVDAGVVFSWGSTDIDRHDSEFHERHEVGVRGGNGYYTIDTGKLTCAPYFAQQLAEKL